MSDWRTKITIVRKGEVQTFDQMAEGEGRDEFRGRAHYEAAIPDGAEYHEFESTGHWFAGPVPEVHLGHKRRHHHYAPDDMLPGLFLRRGSRVYDYKEAPRD